MAQISSHWVFGYGSLIWRPGFSFVRQVPALLRGAHRRLCVYSYRHRGTEAQPGLVFGLMPGGSCRGMAFEIAAEAWGEVQDYLRAREMDRGVYRETMRPILLDSGAIATAMTFLADTQHVQYAGKLAIAEQVRLVRLGVGESGANPEYVLQTARKLEEMGIRDRHLDELARVLRGVDVPVVESA